MSCARLLTTQAEGAAAFADARHYVSKHLSPKGTARTPHTIVRQKPFDRAFARLLVTPKTP